MIRRDPMTGMPEPSGVVTGPPPGYTNNNNTDDCGCCSCIGTCICLIVGALVFVLWQIGVFD